MTRQTNISEMKLKERIKQLERRIAELENEVKSDDR